MLASREYRILFCLALILLSAAGNAQEDREKSVRLKKHERIYLAAYDDTTRALATLFLVKRHRITGPAAPNEAQRYLLGFDMTATWIVFGVSTAVLTTGLIMVENSSTDSNEESFGFLIPLVGGAVMIGSGLTLGIQYLLLTPYSVRKYFKLLEAYKENGKLPRYYEKRLAKYLQ